MELKDNRYYTPDDVSELHVGLECVWTMLDNGFKNVRIKYIDGEDLENLGFSKTDKKDPYTGSNLYMKNIEYGFNTGVNITDSIAMAIERAINKGETYTDVEIISKNDKLLYNQSIYEFIRLYNIVGTTYFQIR